MIEEKARHVFYFLILVSPVTAIYQNLSLQERIPIYLQELCPGTGVCLNDDINPDDKEPSCCGGMFIRDLKMTRNSAGNSRSRNVCIVNKGDIKCDFDDKGHP